MTHNHFWHLMHSFADFTRKGGGVTLREYQLAPARAILESVQRNLGLDFVVIMPRQAGKDELLAQLTAYLMRVMCRQDRGIVEVNPTYRPQTIGAILRLENRLDRNLLTQLRWKKRADFLRLIGECRTAFYSGDGQANVVGATANLLLIINEAQDILPAIYAKNFAPMAASRAATRLFCGTVETSDTLLAQMTRVCRQAEQADGRQRVFFYTAEDVRRENPPYGKFVDEQVSQMGRNHPLVKTQYFCEEIDAETGMFGPTRRALMQGDQPAQDQPHPGALYAFLLDVGGQTMDDGPLTMDGQTMDDGPLTMVDGLSSNLQRDSSALTIVEIDLSSLALLQAPTYRAVRRLQWTGLNHLRLFGALKSLGEAWKPQHFVIDATGVGEGLWAMLGRAFPGRVQPVRITQQEKSEIGWRFLSIIETGRFRDCCPTDEVRAQYAACRSEILPGPRRTLRWGVPEGRRGPRGEILHDDMLLADSLVARLDQLEWHSSLPPKIVPGADPLDGMDGRF
jgi:Terminase RNaseH-like domain